jgi:DNA-directed RNA polymerase specialized sigma24 family protein
MKYEETFKEIDTYNLVKKRKKLLEDRLEVYNSKNPVITNNIEPWKMDSLYTLDINSILDDLEKCDKAISEIDAAMNTLDENVKNVVDLRLIVGLNWIDLAEEAEYSIRTCNRLFNMGLEQIDVELKKIRGGYGS